MGNDYDDAYKSPAAEAHERVLARQPPTDEDARITAPLLKRIADRERIPFLLVDGGLVIGFSGILYPQLLGGRQARRIIQSNDRVYRQDRSISARELDSEGAVGSGGMLYTSGLDDGIDSHDDGDGYDWETSGQQAGFDAAFDRSQMRLMVAEVERLENQGETIETSELLKAYKEELGLNTYQGRIKSADPEGEKIRQRVYHNLHDFYEMLEEYDDDESQWLATHFRKHIKTGGTCRYNGDRKWRYS